MFKFNANIYQRTDSLTDTITCLFFIMFKANLGPLGPNCQQKQVFLCAFLPNHKVGFIVCLDVIMWTKLIGLTLTSMKVI